MGVRFETEVQRAEKRGFRVRGGGRPEVTVTAPLTARGFIHFVLLTPVGWICDECGARVTVSQFWRHAEAPVSKGGHR